MAVDKEYIEMCLKAQEIQDLKTRYYLGDKFINIGLNGSDEVYIVTSYSLSNDSNNFIGTFLTEDCDEIKIFVLEEQKELIKWIPRFEDISGIMNNKNVAGFASWADNFNIFIRTLDTITIEKQFLCYCMYSKFGKFWRNREKGWV